MGWEQTSSQSHVYEWNMLIVFPCKVCGFAKGKVQGKLMLQRVAQSGKDRKSSAQ